MKHLTEEELIECFYNKNTAANRASRHLEHCAACAEAYAALESDLALVTPAEPPARDAAYGARVWASISGSLPRFEASKRRWPRISIWSGLSYAAACAVLIACAFIAGRVWEHLQIRTTAGTNPTTIPQPAAPPQQRLVVVVLSDHLERSERLLVELKHADADSAEMVSPLRDEARSLLTANRICRQNAEKNDDPALAEALDRLDHLLVELANQQGGLNATALARLQNEMNSDSLLFEVRVLRSRIPDQQPAANSRPKGGTI
jgi:hypothetical protein